MQKRHNAIRPAWAEVHARLARTQEAIDSANNPDADAEADTRLLRERAIQMALPVATETARQDDLHVLAFMTGGERHAFEARYVTRVYAYVPPTPLPGLPPYIVGIMMAEGHILSIVDLRSLLHIPVSNLAEPTAVIVLSNEANEFGVLADEILGIERHANTAVQPDASITNGKDSFLQGVTVSRTGILNASRLLNDPRLIIDAS